MLAQKQRKLSWVPLLRSKRLQSESECSRLFKTPAEHYACCLR